MLNEFVEKIVVHEGDRSSGKRVQKVDIYLNFIGYQNLDAPLPEKTTEELETERKLDEKRRRPRENQREYRARKKTKKAA